MGAAGHLIPMEEKIGTGLLPALRSEDEAECDWQGDMHNTSVSNSFTADQGGVCQPPACFVEDELSLCR